MKKTIKVKQTEDGEAYLDLADFADMIDISKAKKYKLETITDLETEAEVLCITFYDKKGKIVETKD